MTHAEENFQYFEVLQNSDQTEGRGPMKAVGQFKELKDAVEDAKGRGVMGIGDGEVEEVNVYFKEDGRVIIERFKVYGFMRLPEGGYGSGYLSEFEKRASRKVSTGK